MLLRLRSALMATALALVVAACSKISEENFAKIQEGMTEQEVLTILGTPTESNGVSVLGVSGAAWRWVGRDAIIVVHFVNGKAALRTLARPAGS
jgi:hypothetical protein